MNGKAILISGIFMFVLLFAAQAQVIERVEVTDSDRLAGISQRFLSVNTFDGFVELVLYKNNVYKYRVESTNYSKFSTGTWKIMHKLLYLKSSLVDDNVSVQMQVQQEADSSLRKSLFNVPTDLLGNRYPDTKVYVNNYKSFCFPFFDTCVLRIKRIKRVQLDFGNGFRSGWIRTKLTARSAIAIVVQEEIDLNNYLVFRNRRYKFVDQGIELSRE